MLLRSHHRHLDHHSMAWILQLQQSVICSQVVVHGPRLPLPTPPLRTCYQHPLCSLFSVTKLLRRPCIFERLHGTRADDLGIFRFFQPGGNDRLYNRTLLRG